ncbi:MAG: pilus assembly protein [Desulfovibrionaceae bacterium]|nr:pilus assembly protein [Desulfovibrionaceae bacterium]
MQSSRNKRQRRGLAAVEMALVLPVFLLLLMGIMDVSRLYWTQGVVRDAAFEGARTAILHEPTTLQVETAVVEKLAAGGVGREPAITVGAREPDQPVDVTVSVPFEFYVLGSIIPSLDGNKPVSATAVMTHER